MNYVCRLGVQNSKIFFMDTTDDPLHFVCVADTYSTFPKHDKIPSALPPLASLKQVCLALAKSAKRHRKGDLEHRRKRANVVYECYIHTKLQYLVLIPAPFPY